MKQSVIDNVYDELRQCYTTVYDVETALTDAKRTYVARMTQLLTAGVEGKNKEQRDAALDAALTVESQAVASMEAQLAYAKLLLKLADLERSRCRMIVENEGNQVKP